jgi:outer membrane protein assembly factor BamE (lipoprotein component of BamABCDE complex)
MRSRSFVVLVLTSALLLPGCLVFHDHAGVPVTEDMFAAIEPGQSTRAEVLAVAGAPTGLYGTNLLSTATRAGASFEQPSTPGRIQPDVYTWQEIDVRAQMTFFPVLFFWSTAEITSRTLMVVFDEDGVVVDKAFREDGP